MARGTIDRGQAPRVGTVGGRASDFAISFDVRTAWDFLMSAGLRDAPDQDLAPVDREWLTEARASLSDEQRRALDGLFVAHGSAALDGLPPLIIERDDIRTAADVVRFLESVAPSELLGSLLRECLTDTVPDELLERASTGDMGAIDTLEPTLCAPELGPIVRDLAADLDGAQRRAVEVARAWLVAFEPIEGRLARIHAADVAMRRSDVAELPPSDALERITGGLRLVPEPRLRRVLLGPSVFVRPYNFIHQRADWRMLWYPVADEVLETDEGAPSSSMIRLFRALGDPSRLQVLRLLTERDWYLTELATKVELSKPTMKHHLAMLRAAGLVTVIEEGSLTYYRLRRERLTEGGSELRRYLRA